MDFMNMVPEMVQVLKLNICALGVIALYRLATPFSELPRFQVGIIKVVIPDGGSTISKRPLLKGHAFVTNAIWTLLRI